eukprot:482000_1
MTPTLDELKLELEELKHLSETSTVPRNKTRLNQAIESVSAEIRTLEMSVSARLAETTSAFPPEGVEDKKSMTDKIDNHHPVGKVAYNQVKSFSWDAGSYNSGFVTVYVPLEGVGTVKDSVSCTFKEREFDLIVDGLKSGPCRLLKSNLDKEIDPYMSKFIVKQNKVIVKLKKMKDGISYDYWTNLTQKHPKANEKGGKDTPDIMGMIKDLYDEGDDNTKKMLAETMMKQRMENQRG